MSKSGKKSSRQEPARPPSQLMLSVRPGPNAQAALRAALDAAAIAVVRIAAGEGQGLSAGEVKSLVGLAQADGAAALITDDAQLARTVRADGVLLTWQGDRGAGGLEQDLDFDPEALDDAGHDRAIEAMLARIDEARSILGGQAIVGVVTADTREAAMRLGEAAIDFMAFDQADEAKRLAFVKWWAEVFEVPCIAMRTYVELGDEMTAALFAHGGADFLEIGPGLAGGDLAGAVTAVADAVGVVDA